MNVFSHVDVSEKDLCVPNPCKNEGHCEPLGFSFQCHCAVGFKGTHCEGKQLFKVVESRKRYFMI